MATYKRKITFGFPEFWDKVAEEFSQFFGQSDSLTKLVDDVCRDAVAALQKRHPKQARVIYPLVRSAANIFTELITLVGNGCGLGAMKLARSMFEACVYAEYLRRNPSEIQDFLDYGYVQNWKRHQQLSKEFPELVKTVKPEALRILEQNYKRVRAKFEDKHGRLRNHWHKKPIAQMASDAEMTDAYEWSYSFSSSLHHLSFEGLQAHINLQEAGASIQQPPSMKWLREALATGHAHVLEALGTLNKCLKLGFDKELQAAQEEWKRLWLTSKQMDQKVKSSGYSSRQAP